MKDITPVFLAFRAQANAIWKKTFKGMSMEACGGCFWDWRDVFDRMCVDLLELHLFCLLDEGDYTKDPSRTWAQRCVNRIRVTVDLPPGERVTELVVSKERHDVSLTYREDYFSEPRAQLCFVDFFDYGSDGRRVFEYVQCRVVKHPKRELIGHDVFIPVKVARFWLAPRPQKQRVGVKQN